MKVVMVNQVIIRYDGTCYGVFNGHHPNIRVPFDDMLHHFIKRKALHQAYAITKEILGHLMVVAPLYSLYGHFYILHLKSIA